MSFRIRPDRDFTAEFRAAAGDELTAAIDTLTNRPDGGHEAIHAFRKNVKRVRSLYRLVARAAPDFQKRENARLRDAAGGFSAIRDAEALIGTLDWLTEDLKTAPDKKALARIRARLVERRDRMAQAETGVEDRMRNAARQLQEALEALDEVAFPARHARAARMVAKAWRRTARRAQKAIAAARADADAEHFHDLRKRTQDYRAFLGLLRDIWPSALKAKRVGANALADRLGRANDLAVLAALTEREPDLFGARDDLDRLNHILTARLSQERELALEAAEAVYADDPDEEAARVELLFAASY